MADLIGGVAVWYPARSLGDGRIKAPTIRSILVILMQQPQHVILMQIVATFSCLPQLPHFSCLHLLRLLPLPLPLPRRRRLLLLLLGLLRLLQRRLLLLLRRRRR